MSAPILTLEVHVEHDVVLARQRARQISGLLGFDQQDQTRIATAVSEMARNAFKYAGGGRVEFAITGEPPAFTIRISDHGRGIRDLQSILDGRYESATGMGLGIVGAKRLMDIFDIQSSHNTGDTGDTGDTGSTGTTVTLGKHLPKRAPQPGPGSLGRIADELARQRPSGPLDELQQQNQELLRTLEELRAQKAELAQVNKELEATNRGVVALYAELDERADYLQRANEIKSRFLSNMTHEFRTPLNSITSLTRILLLRLDGDLTAEQVKQIKFIARAAGDLSELVNDLLDLAKVEAGKLLVRPSEFKVADLFAALRGMLRPLMAHNTSLTLIFDEPAPELVMHTDESKVSQILRNFVSNAIKFTEMGEVRVTATMRPDNTVAFSVADTGIGIAPEDQERIFEEYAQIESPLQHRVKGTGLGLSLSRKLAGLLGGSVRVKSEIDRGSTFYAIIPAEFKGPKEAAFVPELSRQVDPTRAPVLVVEDNREALFVYEKFLKGSGYQVLPARTLKEAREWLRSIQPVAVILDILLETESSWSFITELNASEKTRDIPLVVITMVENEKRALSLGADAFHAKPVDQGWLLHTLARLTENKPQDTLLIIDDDEASRYILRGMLADTRFRIIEASSGQEGLRYARAERPTVIILDLVMPRMDGFTVLDELKSAPDTRDIPVIVHTSKLLTESDRARLSAAVTIVPKESPSRDVALTKIHNALLSAGLAYPAVPPEVPLHD